MRICYVYNVLEMVWNWYLEIRICILSGNLVMMYTFLGYFYKMLKFV